MRNFKVGHGRHLIPYVLVSPVWPSNQIQSKRTDRKTPGTERRIHWNWRKTDHSHSKDSTPVAKLPSGSECSLMSQTGIFRGSSGIEYRGHVGSVQFS